MQAGSGHAVDNIGKQCTFLVQDLADPLLDTVRGKVGEHMHRAGLPNPMGTIFCLCLNRWIPPTVEMEHHRGSRQVQPYAASPKRGNQHAPARVGGE